MSATKRLLRLVTVGHVDHGKSTLVGRLLHETGSLPEGRYDAVKSHCDANGRAFEFAFLLDALAEEREQGVTIDTAQVWLNTASGRCVIFDAPGHVEFVKNAVCGAASADVALILLDANEGIREQSLRHGRLAQFLGIERAVVVINKMDKVEWSHERFLELERDYRDYLAKLGYGAMAVIPISARDGDNVSKRGTRCPWYSGPTVLEAIEAMRVKDAVLGDPLRFTVQGVYKFDERRIVAGRVEAGELHVGQRVLFSPSNRSSVVKSIERWSVRDSASVAYAPEAIGITLEDPIFIERGEVGSEFDGLHPVVTDVFRARVLWLGKKPLRPGAPYTLKLLNQELRAEVESVDEVIDGETLLSRQGDEIPTNELGEVTMRTERPIALDAYATSRSSGRFVLVADHQVSGGGTVGALLYPDQRERLHPVIASENITWESSLVTAEDRARREGQPGAVIWMTGLSGAGKSTLARILEKRLFEMGTRTYRLDGDNVRHGLNSDLGFSPDDRAENIRRVSEVANLFADAGVVVISSFISPYRSDRARARQIVTSGRFIEVFVDASLDVCESRDPKGLYKKARAGKIQGFTGLTAPYEKPVAPDLYVNTEDITPEAAIDLLLERLAQLSIITKSADSRRQ